MSVRRSKLQILIDILVTVQNQRANAKFTHILYKANLTHKRLKEYLDMLMGRGFIEEVRGKGRSTYKITPKGEEFLSEFHRLSEFSEAFGIPL